MNKPKKQHSALFLLLLLGVISCAIPISSSTKYPIDVFYENQAVDRPYSEIGLIEIGSEDSLTAGQTTDKKMLMRGNDARTKELLLAKLVLKAQKIGADALIEVKYKYYTSISKEGYMLSGIAVRYRGQ
ncbi:hypothetical protein CLV98_101710 [Dyadobacter jejuensis]|uniref:Heavy-metal-binding protein n=1 Tax=Dyadobacter jejuensis TaxID=1082580 RepID=A0A316AS64_9BACT|nr:hypothetical protein [Dyadobacter jejuensis]PWJ60525.1 hypothetical protein CLV98_101710 [Dyadobacter jejuensis]